MSVNYHHEGEVSSLPYPHRLGNWRADSLQELPLGLSHVDMGVVW